MFNTAEDFRQRLRASINEYEAILSAIGAVPLNAEHYEQLIRRGEFFAGASLAKTNSTLKAHVKRHRPKAKGCYYNCQWFVVNDNTDCATYYEGYFTGPNGILIHHAWLVIGGAVFDPTDEAAHRALVKLLGKSKPDVSEQKYFGLAFPKMAVVEAMLEECCGPLLELTDTA